MQPSSFTFHSEPLGFTVGSETSYARRYPEQSPTMRTSSTMTGDVHVGGGSVICHCFFPVSRSTESRRPVLVVRKTVSSCSPGVAHAPPIPPRPEIGRFHTTGRFGFRGFSFMSCPAC